MAFVSFHRGNYDGNKPTTSKIDGQLLLDTKTGFAYADVGNERLTIKDPNTPARIESNEELNQATRNGWYYLDYGEDDNGQSIPFSISVEGMGKTIVTATSGHLSVDGNGVGNNLITQTLFIHTGTTGKSFTRYT
jgi:hypothetical protein